MQVNYLKAQIKNIRGGLPTWQCRQPDRQDSPQSSLPDVDDHEYSDDDNGGENYLSVSAGQARGETVEAALLDGRTARHQSHAVGQRELLQNK